MVASANYNVYGPQPHDGIYLFYGKEDEPKNVPNQLTLTLDETSVSYQSILATVTMPVGLIEDRDITRFYIVRNGQRIVDWFDPAYDNWTDRYYRYYPLTIRVTDEYIGSIMEFQIVAVAGIEQQGSWNEYVVAWSNISPAIQFKPLPTVDHNAIHVLELILGRLEAMQNELSNKMNQMTQAIEKIYTPTQQSVDRLENAIDSVMEKLPMTELSEEISELNQTLNDSKNALKDPDQEEITLGGKFRLIPELPESEVAFLDLTEYKDFISTFRFLMECMLWVYFFQMFMNWITPKPEI